MLFKHFSLLVTLSLLLSPFSLLHAQTRSQVYGDDLTKQAQTLYVSAVTGMTTFESEAAGSKETQSTNGYEIGGWFGEARLVGLKVASHTDSVPYALNNSESRQKFTDVRMAARLWWFTPSVGVSVSEVDIQQTGAKTVGLFGTGINAGLGVNVAVYKGVVVNADVMTVRSNNVYDKLSKQSELGQRNEADSHLAFDLTDRIIDLIVGYRKQDYTIATEDKTYAESSQGAYAGLRLGVYF